MSGAPMEELREALALLAATADVPQPHLAEALSSALEELERLRSGDPFGLAQVPPNGPCQRCMTNQATHHRSYCENCIQDLVIVEREAEDVEGCIREACEALGAPESSPRELVEQALIVERELRSLRSELAEVRRERDESERHHASEQEALREEVRANLARAEAIGREKDRALESAAEFEAMMNGYADRMTAAESALSEARKALEAIRGCQQNCGHCFHVAKRALTPKEPKP